jgi:hypothetical protein
MPSMRDERTKKRFAKLAKPMTALAWTATAGPSSTSLSHEAVTERRLASGYCLPGDGAAHGCVPPRPGRGIVVPRRRSLTDAPTSPHHVLPRVAARSISDTRSRTAPCRRRRSKLTARSGTGRPLRKRGLRGRPPRLDDEGRPRPCRATGRAGLVKLCALFAGTLPGAAEALLGAPRVRWTPHAGCDTISVYESGTHNAVSRGVGKSWLSSGRPSGSRRPRGARGRPVQRGAEPPRHRRRAFDLVGEGAVEPTAHQVATYAGVRPAVSSATSTWSPSRWTNGSWPRPRRSCSARSRAGAWSGGPPQS